jgi:[protein-PII] uridylyltransferase
MSITEVDHRRAIIDRRAVADRLAALRPGKKIGEHAAAILADALTGGRAEVARRLAQEPGNGAGDRISPRPARPANL